MGIQDRDSIYREPKNSLSPISLVNFLSARNLYSDVLWRTKRKTKERYLLVFLLTSIYGLLPKNFSNSFWKLLFILLPALMGMLLFTLAKNSNLFSFLFCSNSTLYHSGNPSLSPSPLFYPIYLDGILKSLNVRNVSILNDMSRSFEGVLIWASALLFKYFLYDLILKLSINVGKAQILLNIALFLFFFFK